MRALALTTLLLLTACASQPSVITSNANVSFASFLRMLEIDAEKQGLNAQLLKDAFGPRPVPYERSITAQAAQPELTNPFQAYQDRIVNPTRIANGQAYYKEHLETLQRVSEETDVPASLIVALIGIESNYGRNMGDIPVIKALATLAWSDTKRPEFFRKETFAALKVATQTGRSAEELTGSWAGALGRCQFMPTNWLKLAVDGNEDGKVDLINSDADAIASAANFLKQAGWSGPVEYAMRAIGKAKSVPTGISLNDRGLSEPMSEAEWTAKNLPNIIADSSSYRYYQPEGAGTMAYVTNHNYDVLLKWNYSSYFATAALDLAHNILQDPAFETIENGY